MRRLSRTRERVASRVSGEDGAAIIFIAIALVALLAMTAFVIDFGRVWEERRELQNGAEAGAFAVGEDCARAIDLCLAPGYDEEVVADLYADANAVDGAAAVDFVQIDPDARTVQVATSTENESGGNSIGMLFAGILGFDEMTVGADATVTWGTPITAWTIPLVFSDCEWRSDAPGFPGENPGTLPSAEEAPITHEMATILFHDPDGENGCDAAPGHDMDADGKLPGGFGWLDANSDCETFVEGGITVGADPGSSPSNGCSYSDFAAMLGKVVLIPYFDDANEQAINGHGNNGEYLIAGYGAFLVSGYRFGGGPPHTQQSGYDDGLTDAVPCGNPERCMSGWFVGHVDIGGGGDLGGENRGVTIVKLIG